MYNSFQDIYLAEFAKRRNKKKRKDAGTKRVVGVGDTRRDLGEARQWASLGQRTISTGHHISREIRGWNKLLGFIR